MRKRGLCSRPVSVRPSVGHVRLCCIQTAEDIIKLLSPPGSPIILVFDPVRRYPIRREPLQRGRKVANYTGLGCFSTEITVYLRNDTR